MSASSPSHITFRSDIAVTVNQQAGSDLDIAESAWVSTDASDDHDRSEKAVSGLINYLIKHRHGTPMEDGYLSVTVEAPIFVAREWMRHRIGSYSELSARYSVLEPVFWVPGIERGIINAGTSARPVMAAADESLFVITANHLTSVYQCSWESYRAMLDAGVANEVARSVLPVAIYTRFRARFNPRSLMHFLSLRWNHPSNRYPTHPQAEIEQAAIQLDGMLAMYWPITHRAFTAHGRVAP